MNNLPLLSLIIFLPLLGAIIIMLFIKKEQVKTIKMFATGVAFLDFLISLPLWTNFNDSEAGFQFVEKASWIPSIGVSYYLGVDGISVLLILLTTLTMLISIVC